MDISNNCCPKHGKYQNDENTPLLAKSESNKSAFHTRFSSTKRFNNFESKQSQNRYCDIDYEQDYNTYDVGQVMEYEKGENFESQNCIDSSEPPQQNSLVTIFSIWNTVIGSSLLAMPWGIHMSGLIPSIIILLATSGLCLFTAHKILEMSKIEGGGEYKIEVIQLCKILIGPGAEKIAQVFSIIVLIGANVAYWVLMTNFLYHSITFLYYLYWETPHKNVMEEMENADLSESKLMFMNQKLQIFFLQSNIPVDIIVLAICFRANLNLTYNQTLQQNFNSKWDLHLAVPMFLAIFIYPILNFNTTAFFTKFNSLGTGAIVYLIAFIIIKSASWGINMDKDAWKDGLKLHATFPAYSGMLCLSFFIHNIIITIMRSNKNQNKNGRDLTVAFCLVTITYLFVGILFYISFPLPKSCIEDNLLNNFSRKDGLTAAGRIILLFQLFTVFPLITYMLRIQLMSCITYSNKNKFMYIMGTNLVILIICVLCSIFLPRIGTILRYTGATSGLIYIFILPSLMHISTGQRHGTLTAIQVCINIFIPIVGFANFISQFFISDS